ncbi:hypothetical protein BX286_1849 [Streptomyces sp. 3211.6]|uniref:hypothetical protein n=1 Tax=Streptomyces sp. 3211.6 TaxID=1938845 RepID=UPI000F12A9A9|nr:hypothetical protein [Streptomyces sp. 3211.6]RKT03909.1 hypothetical protein BX286_1849 [Streptomyces sp. 3211.6]
MRPALDRDHAPAASHTPIFDALYSEYLRAFRALPGDRTGEEDLGFTAFSYGSSHGSSYGSSYGGSYTGSSGVSYGSGSYAAGWNGSAWQRSDPWQPAYPPAPVVPQPQYAHAGAAVPVPASGAGQGSGYGDGRQHQTGMQHIPAALPPAPRRGY